MPTERSLLALRRSVSQAGRRRFDPGRPLSRRQVVRGVVAPDTTFAASTSVPVDLPARCWTASSWWAGERC